MPFGTVVQEPLYRFLDPLTGRAMLRITDIAAHCHHPYFYSRMFTPDGERLLYTSYREGRANAYLVDLRNGKSKQLTDAQSMDAFLATLSADGKHLIYIEKNHLKRLAVDSGKEDILYTQKPPFDGRPIYPGYSSDGRYAFIAQMHRDDVVTGDGWNAFEPQWQKRPRCRLTLVDLVDGSERIIKEDTCWLGHPQIRPGDPSLLMYCHEGPGHLIDNRIWLIDADGKNDRPIRISEREKHSTPTKEIVTHEYFTPDGSSAAAAYLPDGKPGRIIIVDLKSGNADDLGEVHSYLHLIHSPDMRSIVGDERGAREKSAIWLFDIASRTERQVCLHGSSLKPRGASTQDAHPHAAFSPDMRYIVFTSDRETSPDGNCSVYLADMTSDR